MIRLAKTTDLKSITEIYNESILNSNATFDTDVKSVEQQELWFNNHSEQFPVSVYEQENTIMGWASLSKWSDRCAYDSTAEVSIYIHHEHRAKGLGKLMLEDLIMRAKQNGLHCLLARITEGNDASIHIHTQAGFSRVGTLKEVGKKFGRYHDVHMLQLLLS
ncbi:MAG TPA: N-acetyltransferase family protein [Bacteroidia bacterium]|nr:N-acetyltransferase family protein [Bacteroidia bacterium]HNT79300.1 N-acetyltransferase family protein [Bacteroidia bacterium]